MKTKVFVAWGIVLVLVLLSGCCCFGKKTTGNLGQKITDKPSIKPEAATLYKEVKAADFIGKKLVATQTIKDIGTIRSWGIRKGFGHGEPITDFMANEGFVTQNGSTINEGQEFTIQKAVVLQNTDGYGNSGTKLIFETSTTSTGLVFWSYGFDAGKQSFWAIDKEQILVSLEGNFKWE